MAYLHFLSVLTILPPVLSEPENKDSISYIDVNAEKVKFKEGPQVAESVDVTDLKRARNAIYLDLFGIGGAFSINYERKMLDLHNIGLGLRMGFSSYEFYDFNNHFNPDLIFPFSLNFYYGHIHHLELGAGPTFSLVAKAHPTKFTPTRDLLINGHVTIGYRYQKPEGGFLFRIGYTPFFQIARVTHTLFYEDKRTLRHWGNISFGYSF